MINEFKNIPRNRRTEEVLKFIAGRTMPNTGLSKTGSISADLLADTNV